MYFRSEEYVDNDPDETVADGGITVLMVWRKDARRTLGIPEPADPTDEIQESDQTGGAP